MLFSTKSKIYSRNLLFQEFQCTVFLITSLVLWCTFTVTNKIILGKIPREAFYFDADHDLIP